MHARLCISMDQSSIPVMYEVKHQPKSLFSIQKTAFASLLCETGKEDCAGKVYEAYRLRDPMDRVSTPARGEHGEFELASNYDVKFIAQFLSVDTCPCQNDIHGFAIHSVYRPMAVGPGCRRFFVPFLELAQLSALE